MARRVQAPDVLEQLQATGNPALEPLGAERETQNAEGEP